MPVSSLRRFTKRFLILLNLVTAVLFLAGCYNAHFDPSRFWFIGFLTLASLYFLLLLLIFLLFWMFARPVFMLISITAILLAWSPLQNLFRLHMAKDYVIKKHPDNLRVMSWNVEHFDILEYKTHPEIKQQMIAMINEYQPDVACFQEMVGSDKYADAINFVPDFAKQLSMPYVHFSYNKKLDFDGKHHFGIISFSRYPFFNEHTMSYAPNDYNSIFQYADLDKGGDTFRIYNLHLQSLKFSKQNLQYIGEPSVDEGKNLSGSMSLISKFKTGFLKRKVQADHIKTSINESPYPVIVCGDFNDVPNSYAYSTIGKELKNAFTEKGTGIGRTYYSISPTLRIDNIFTSQSFNIEQFTRIKKKMSDHFPLIADLYFKK